MVWFRMVYFLNLLVVGAGNKILIGVYVEIGAFFHLLDFLHSSYISNCLCKLDRSEH